MTPEAVATQPAPAEPEGITEEEALEIGRAVLRSYSMKSDVPLAFTGRAAFDALPARYRPAQSASDVEKVGPRGRQSVSTPDWRAVAEGLAKASAALVLQARQHTSCRPEIAPMSAAIAAFNTAKEQAK